MNKIQEIVPVNIKPNQLGPTESAHATKPKVALRLRRGDLDLTCHNECDKYILYTVLKELIADDRWTKKLELPHKYTRCNCEWHCVQSNGDSQSK